MWFWFFAWFVPMTLANPGWWPLHAVAALAFAELLSAADYQQDHKPKRTERQTHSDIGIEHLLPVLAALLLAIGAAVMNWSHLWVWFGIAAAAYVLVLTIGIRRIEVRR